VIEIFVLSLIQGVTEFLPISSSSHLIFISENFNFENQSLSIDTSLHIGSFAAVILYFRKDVVNFYKNKILFLQIFISSIPIIVIGFLMVQTNFIDKFRNMEIIAWTTILFGVLLYISDKFRADKNIRNNFNFKAAFVIGLFQIFSLIPGVSRSGIAITISRFLKFKREDAVKISFLLSIPILGAVSLYGIKNILFSEDVGFTNLNIISIILSFIFSFITIKYLLTYIKKFSFNVFVYYRIFLGLILLYIYYL